jgi:uncharacterized protein (UPF0333 family)
MKKIKNNQMGFSAVEVLMLVVIVALLGTVGYLFYKNHNKTTPAATTTNTGAPATQTTPATTTTPTVDTTNYLVIKEWGIKVKIPNADKLTYTIVTQDGGTTPDGSGQYVDAAVLSLANSVTTNASCKKLGVGINRAKLIKSSSPLPTVGSYVYDVSGSPFSCDNAQLDAIRTNYTGNNPNSWLYSAN